VFCSPPRTGSTWFLNAVAASGLNMLDGGSKDKHSIGVFNQSDFRVTLVRHPYNWLRSYYFSIAGGHVGVPLLDNIFPVLYRETGSFSKFINVIVTDFPGLVCRVFDAYKASTIMRLEDMPWAAVLFMRQINAPNPVGPRAIGKLNGTKELPPVDEKLRYLLSRSEEEFCDRYEYI
jgi:hypothetical protein